GLKFSWSSEDSKLVISHDGFDPLQHYYVSAGPRITSKSGEILMKRYFINFDAIYTSLAPELTNLGIITVDGKYLFLVEYQDRNNDSANKSVLHLIKDDEPYQQNELKLITPDIADKMQNQFELNPVLYDGNYRNGELFYLEVELIPGKYRYYFEFEDSNGAPAQGENAPLSQDSAIKGPTIEGEQKDDADTDEDLTLITVLILIIIIVILLGLSIVSRKSRYETLKEDAESEEDLSE
ncbi:MAG: hypothetical protein JSV49_11625, partial [Thermoplasmata archaeon]